MYLQITSRLVYNYIIKTNGLTLKNFFSQSTE